MKAKDILATKGTSVITIPEESDVQQAVEELTSRKIGFLIVMNAGGDVTGVLSERDVINKCVSARKDPAACRVKEIMTPRERIVLGFEEDDIQSIMNTMTERKIRHLPIFRENALTGIISIGDVVKVLLESKDKEIQALSAYVQGNYPG
ncbi:MAG: CBS domain-containing protein [Bacteroidetes bacterium]|nr:MAG: CBS domain-containing protein [Bacteroidota bacterium]